MVSIILVVVSEVAIVVVVTMIVCESGRGSNSVYRWELTQAFSCISACSLLNNNRKLELFSYFR